MPHFSSPNVPSIPEIGLTEIDGEPRARDIEIAERLGLDRPRKLRDLIERNRAEIEGFGEIKETDATTHGGTRPTAGRVFWLTEEQALLVAALSKAPNAPAVRAMLIRCFVAWRRGHLAPAIPAHSVADFEAEARKVIGGIVKSVVHAQVAPIVETVNALVAIVQPSVPGVVIRHGKTAGAILKANGFTGCPQCLAAWFGNRLEAAGCRVEGRIDTGTSRSRLFDPDKAEAWLANGGRASVEMKLAERRGQGALALPGPRHVVARGNQVLPTFPPDMHEEGMGLVVINGEPVFFDVRDTDIGPGDRAVVILSNGTVEVGNARPVHDYVPFGSRTCMSSPRMAKTHPNRDQMVPIEHLGAILGKVIERQNVVRLPAAAH